MVFQVRKHFLCPACGGKMRYYGSELKNELFRQTYALCTNAACQARWVFHTEIVKCITPPQAPYQNPIKEKGDRA